MRMRFGSLAILCLAAACGGETSFNPTPGPGQESGAPSSDGGGPLTEGGLKPMPDLGSCGGQTIPIKLVQKGDVPDLFLIVDRSGSMMMPIDFFDWAKGTKWDVMRKTLTSLVTTYQVNIQFGLSLFPSDASCGPGKIDVALAANNWQQVQKALQIGPDGNTPSHTTIAAVTGYLSTVAPAKGGRFALLATDGAPNCGAQADSDTGPETLAEVQKLVAAGTKVFVVGFGEIVAGNPALLNQLAQAGGVPNPKPPHAFYPATNEAELKAALFSIAGGIIPPPCTYALTTKPDDPEKVTVTFDGKPVPRSKSSTAGWNYTSGGTEITFFGAACDQLRNGQVKEVKFLFGCKGPVIE